MADQSIDPTKLTYGSISPFLPNTNIQFAWDSTCISMFKTCPRMYQYTMIEGWSPKGESVHLRFGAEYHSALENYDKLRCKGLSHPEAVHDTIYDLLITTWDYDLDENGVAIPGTGSPALPDLGTEHRAQHYKNRASLLGLVLDYLDHFENDPAATYIMSDGTPAVELSFRFELEFGPTAYTKGEPGEISLIPGSINYVDGPEYPPSQPYVLCGHLDRVVDFNDQLLVMDRKTTQTTPGKYFFRQFEPNVQMTLYTIAGKIVLDTPIKGVVIDAAQIKLEEPNSFVRGFTYRTQDQLEEWLGDLEIMFADAETYATSGYWPMNDTACDKYGGCKFRDVCSKSPGVREMFLKADFDKLEIQDRWNPLKSRG